MKANSGKGLLFYLLNPPAARHQRTAYLSATLTSSNRPGTAVDTHTHATQSCHTLLLHETSLTCQTAMTFKSPAHQFGSCYSADSDISGNCVLPLSWRNVGGGLRVRTEESCVRRSELPIICTNTHTCTKKKRLATCQLQLLTAVPVVSLYNYFNLRLPSGTER